MLYGITNTGGARCIILASTLIIEASHQSSFCIASLHTCIHSWYLCVHIRGCSLLANIEEVKVADTSSCGSGLISERRCNSTFLVNICICDIRNSMYIDSLSLRLCAFIRSLSLRETV